MAEPVALSPLELAHAAMAGLRSRLWLVLLCLIAVPAAAFALNQTGHRYEATAKLAYVPFNDNLTLARVGVPLSSAPTADQLTADSIVDDLNRRLGLRTTRQDLRGRLRVDQPEGSAQATLTATARSSRAAAELANEWAIVVVESRNAAVAGQFNSARRVLRSRIRRGGDSEELRGGRARLLELETARASFPGDTQIVERVTRGTWGNRYPVGVAAALGLVGGIALALGTSLLITRRMLTPAVAATNFQAPLLGVIEPLSRARRRRKSAAKLEALGQRTLNSGVLLKSRLALVADMDSPLLVAPAKDHRFRSRIAECLAAAHADGGHSTVLVRWLGHGVTFDPSSLPEKLKVVEASGGWTALESRLQELSKRYEVVVVDAPGVLESGDALLATQHLPVWLVTAGLDETRADDADALRRETAGLEREPVGLAVGAANRRLSGRPDHPAGAAGWRALARRRGGGRRPAGDARWRRWLRKRSRS